MRWEGSWVAEHEAKGMGPRTCARLGGMRKGAGRGWRTVHVACPGSWASFTPQKHEAPASSLKVSSPRMVICAALAASETRRGRGRGEAASGISSTEHGARVRQTGRERASERRVAAAHGHARGALGGGGLFGAAASFGASRFLFIQPSRSSTAAERMCAAGQVRAGRRGACRPPACASLPRRKVRPGVDAGRPPVRALGWRATPSTSTGGVVPNVQCMSPASVISWKFA